MSKTLFEHIFPPTIKNGYGTRFLQHTFCAWQDRDGACECTVLLFRVGKLDEEAGHGERSRLQLLFKLGGTENLLAVNAFPKHYKLGCQLFCC